MAIVYIHKRKDNDQVFYVGIGKTERRVNSKDSRNEHWKNIAKKYGYTSTITHKDIIWEEAITIEKYLIAFYGRNDLGLGSLVNKTDGGEGFINLSNDSIEIIRNKNIGRKHTDETKLKLKSYIRTDEHKQKLSDSHKGKRLSDDAKKHLSEINKNKIFSDETKKKLSEARKLYWMKRKNLL